MICLGEQKVLITMEVMEFKESGKEENTYLFYSIFQQTS
jgi:hypothetical protein